MGRLPLALTPSKKDADDRVAPTLTRVYNNNKMQLVRVKGCGETASEIKDEFREK